MVLETDLFADCRGATGQRAIMGPKSKVESYPPWGMPPLSSEAINIPMLATVTQQQIASTAHAMVLASL